MLTAILIIIDCFGAWACGSCGQVNYETRSTCERCGAARP